MNSQSSDSPSFRYQHKYHHAGVLALRACAKVIHEGDDAVSFVISLNLHRRHLNESQRAAVAAKLANMPLGGATYRSANLQTGGAPQVSQADAAKLLNVSTRTVAAAAKVIHEGDESLVKAVERGNGSMAAASLRPLCAGQSAMTPNS